MRFLKTIYITFFIYMSILFFGSGLSHLTKDILLEPLLGLGFLILFVGASICASLVAFVLKRDWWVELDSKNYSTLNNIYLFYITIIIFYICLYKTKLFGLSEFLGVK